MKKLFSLILLFLVGCTPTTVIPTITFTPNPTATATSTSTPIPTPTFSPQFLDLQREIDLGSARFKLLPDGTIEDKSLDGNITIIPDFFVDSNGEFFLKFNGNQIRLDKENVFFNEKWGIQIDGYSYDTEIKKWIEGVIVPEYLNDLYFLEKKTEENKYFEIQEHDLVSGALAERIKQLYKELKIKQVTEWSLVYSVTPKNYQIQAFWQGDRGYEMFFEQPASGVNSVLPGMLKIIDEDGTAKYWLTPKIIKINETGDIEVLMRVRVWLDYFDTNSSVTNRQYGYDLDALPKMQPVILKSIDSCIGLVRFEESWAGCKEWYSIYNRDYTKLLHQWANTGLFPTRLSQMPIFMASFRCIGNC